MQPDPHDQFENTRVSEFLALACDGEALRSDAKDLGGVELNAIGKEGGTPLLWLLMNCERSQDAAGLLVELGADPHIYAEALRTSPAAFAVRNLPSAYTIAMLDAGMDPNFKYRNLLSTPTLLHQAVVYHNREAVSYLIQKGAALESMNANGATPLLSVISNQYDIALMLLEAGADPNARNNDGLGICDIMARTNYTTPETGPDYKALFLEKLKESDVDCASHVPARGDTSLGSRWNAGRPTGSVSQPAEA